MGLFRLSRTLGSHLQMSYSRLSGLFGFSGLFGPGEISFTFHGINLSGLFR